MKAALRPHPAVRQFCLAFAIALSLSVSALAPAAAEARKTLVVAVIKGPSGVGLIRLFDSQPQLPGGLALSPVAVPSADLVTAKLISGEYDAGILPVNVAAKLYNSGLPLKLAAITGDGMLSFISSDPDLHALSDLRGKKVNVTSQGATPDYLFQALLEHDGLLPGKDVDLDYSLSYADAALALAAGKISSAILPEPFSTMALSLNPQLRKPFDVGALWTAQTGQSSYPMTALVVRDSLPRDNPEALSSLLEACKASVSWVIANPEKAGELAEKQAWGLKTAVVTKAVPLSAYVFRPAVEARPEIEALLRIFLRRAPKSVGDRLPDSGFYLVE